MPMLGAYSMSKHALEAMTDIFRLELAQWGIHVAAVEPGAVATPMTDSMATLMAQSRAALPDDKQRLYDAMLDSMTKALDTQSSQSVSTDSVADAIVHALTHPKPKTRYPIGISTAGLITMRNLAPDAVGDAILIRALSLNQSNTS
jgi:NAD(P)-dependent dehydrogenase (short-subunit alcohol dehydrogenase family)